MMPDNVRVTVIVPVHNTGDLLVPCLDSLVRQTLPQVEFLCIDDGSTDGSLAILKSYAKFDERFTVVYQANRGVGPTRNRGIKEAQGTYVTFMDADDYYLSPDTLLKLWEGAERHGVMICGGSFSEDHGTWVRTEFQGVYEKYTFRESRLMDYHDYQFDYGYHRFAYSTKFLRENKILFPPYVRFQDPPFFVRAMTLAGRFYALQEPTYCYRWGHQVLEWNQRRTFDVVCGLQDNLRMADKNGLEELRELTWWRLTGEYRDRIVARVQAGDSRTVARLVECFRYAPRGKASSDLLASMVVEGYAGLAARVTS